MAEGTLYETVIGLEVHAQLLTKTKLFCGDSILYGAEPNTQVSAISLAHPGTLPKMNRKAIEHAIALGLACNCEIIKDNFFARKNYYYPDLPKGYQVSQHTTPICKNGFIMIRTAGIEKKVRLNRIHLEEDAGKSLHEKDHLHSYIDLNRAGTPLVEIVTEPDLRSGDEAFAYLSTIRRWVRYLGICDGNMEEGSLRCDANISVRKKGETKLGTRVEVKNLNSIRNVKRAIEVESRRLIDQLERGETIIQQTRSFNADTGTSFPIRDKEEADDYRYFPEPDLTPFRISDTFIEEIRRSLTVMPEERAMVYASELQLSEYDASLLVDERSFSDYFEELLKASSGIRPKALANWMLGPVKNWLNESGKEISEFPLSPGTLSSLVHLIESGECSFTVGSGKLFAEMIRKPGADPKELAIKMNLLQESDSSSMELVIDKVLKKLGPKVEEYKKGKKGLLALFVGEVMKETKGKADPKLANELLLKKLKP
jgi:aspartyl-tRNA(Asn)/glutamyl-tRNA(Gln) amidotransferase subunit B